MNAMVQTARFGARAAGIARRLVVAAWLLVPGAASGDNVNVIVYEHDGVGDAGLQFITAHPEEIRALDTGWLPGWFRSTLEFKAWAAPGAGRVPICRFYGPGVGSSARHFYTGDADECEGLKSSADWLFEGYAFHAPLPDATGTCAAGTTPLYRSYRQRSRFVQTEPDGQGVQFADGPQHRYAPTPSTVGAEGIAFCVPSSAGIGAERMAALAAGRWQFLLHPPHPSAGREGAVLLSLRSDVQPVVLLAIDDGATYRHAVDGQWGSTRVHGAAGWRPLDDKVVVHVYSDAGFFIMTFAYAGETSVQGTAFALLNCGPIMKVCLHPYPYRVSGTLVQQP